MPRLVLLKLIYIDMLKNENIEIKYNKIEINLNK